MDFGLRLKNLRLDKGYTQQQLSDMVGVSVVALRNWERGTKKPSMDAIVALGDALSVSLDELIGITPKKQTPNSSLVSSLAERKLLSNFRELDEHGQKIVLTLCKMETERVKIKRQEAVAKVIDFRDGSGSERYIPRYATPSAAGTSVPLDGDDFEMILADETVPFNADYAVNIQGDSMEPYIHDGDMVFVTKDVPLSIGDVGIFSVDGAMYCKQYYLDDEGNLILVSANPALRHTNVFVNADSGQNVKACGKVLLDRRIELPAYLTEE